MKLLLPLFLAFTLISCNQEKKESKEDTSVTVKVAGVSQIGKVQVGDYRHTGIKITNRSGSAVSFNLPTINPPFSWDGYTGDCIGASVPSKSSCTLKIRFEPIDTIERFTEFSFLGQTFKFSGRGMRAGELAINTSVWNAGSFIAGVPQLRTIPVTNIGDANISIPKIVNPEVFLITHSCGEEITPSENCNLVVSMNKTIAQEYDETISFFVDENPLVMANIQFLGDVRPNVPSGIIEFQVGSTTIVADGLSEVDITTRPARDQFGNVVSDGSIITANLMNLEQVDPMSKTTENGIVTFKVRSTNFTGVSRIVLSGGNATGVYNITSISGPVEGEIKVRAYNPQLLANNMSYLTLETLPMIAKTGNTVTDGTELSVEVVGPVHLISQEFFTVNGVIQIRLRSTHTSGVGEVIVRGDPVYDELGVVTGYLAEGRFPLEFLPVENIGNMNITSSHQAIYAKQTGEGYDEVATITVDDIRDEFMNLVGSGRSVQISLTNGLNTLGESDFTLTTDAYSRVSFNLRGIGVRDWIGITATINDQSKFHRVFAYSDETKLHNKGITNKIILKTAKRDSKFTVDDLRPDDNLWRPVETNYYSIRSQDTSNYGSIYSFGDWREIDGPKRHLVWDCIVPSDNYVVVSPCIEKKRNGDSYLYRSTPLMEIVPHREVTTFTNSYILVLPTDSQGFGTPVIGPSVSYNEATGKITIVGGVKKVDSFSGGPIDSGAEMNETPLVYGDIPLMSYLPKVNTSHDQDLRFPIATSYFRYKERTYFFGGLRFSGMTGMTLGNILQKLENDDLTNMTVVDGVNGSPAGRYNNAVFYDDKLDTLYILGGRNEIGMFLDEIWKVDFKQSPLRWNQVCDACGLPNYVPDNFGIFSNLNNGGQLPESEWMTIMEGVRPPVMFKDNSSGKIFFTLPNSTIISEINPELGLVNNTVTDINFLDFRNYAQLVHNQKDDRFFKHTIAQAGTSNTRFYHKDGRLGEMRYYMAEVEVDDESALFAQDITPVISAYSENTTISGGSSITEYGVSAYIFDHSINQWELIGESNGTTPNFMTMNNYNIRRTLTDATKYISGNRVKILIKPTHELGYQIGSSVNPAVNHFLINFIKLDGVM